MGECVQKVSVGGGGGGGVSQCMSEVGGQGGMSDMPA